LLSRSLVGDEIVPLAGTGHVADANAVDHDARVLDAPAVDRHERVLQVARATDIHHIAAGRALRGREARDEDGLREMTAAGRNRFEYVLGQGTLGIRALDVDDWRLSRHGDGFRHRPYLQFRVDGGGKRSGQLDAFALDGGEPSQGKRDGISARPQVYDPVL